MYRIYARHHAGLVDELTFRRTVAELQKEGEGRNSPLDAQHAKFWAFVAYADASPVDLELARPYLDKAERGIFEMERGRVLLLSGRLDDALPPLRTAVAACYALEAPFTFIHARLWLGEALEAKGDIPGACAQYLDVVDRWKNAKPRSITLEKAKARSRVLHCAVAR